MLQWSEVWRRAESIYTLCEMHGPGHWRRVERHGIVLAENTPGADVELVRMFAILHDCCRQNDGHDPLHGSRAAAFGREINDELLNLSPDRLALLCDAMTRHTNGERTEEPTMGCCWDADRLDLPRVGITPTAYYLSTEKGRQLARGIVQTARR